MGADGTEDNVSVKICSDANDLCCQNVMKKIPNEDWRAGATATMILFFVTLFPWIILQL